MADLQKDFFTLAEVAERWRHAGIVDDAVLLKLAIEDRIVFAFYQRELGSYAETFEVPDGRVTRTHDVAFRYVAPGTARYPLRYLKSDDTRRILEARGTERILVHVDYSSPTRTRETGTGHFNNAPQLTRDDLLVSREECDRFERESKIRLHPPLLKLVWGWLADQANQRVLVMLSGWIAAIATGLWTWYVYTPPKPPEPSPTFSAAPAPTSPSKSSSAP